METLPGTNNQVAQSDSRTPSITDAELRTLSISLQRAAGRIRHRVSWYFGSFGVVLLFMSMIGYFMGYRGIELLIMFSVAAGIAATFPVTSLRWGWHRRTARKLAELDDIRALAPLADALSFPGTDVLYTVRPGLLRLLRRIRSEDVALLTMQQRDNLRQLLFGTDVPVILALMSAYQQIGEGRELDAVQSPLKGKGEMAHDPQVRSAALECLPFLEAAFERSRMNETLLRPSDQPPATPAQLLRPITTTETTEPQQLLRSTTDPMS